MKEHGMDENEKEGQDEPVKSVKQFNLGDFLQDFSLWMSRGTDERKTRGDELLSATFHGLATWATTGLWIPVVLLWYVGVFYRRTDTSQYVDVFEEVDE